MVVLPAIRLVPEFFQLETAMAGEWLQKFQNYEMRLVIVGDIAVHTASSRALRDLVYESNRGANGMVSGRYQ